MCGIAGILTNNHSRDALRQQMEKAVASLAHRGPDDSGIWMNQTGVALGHTRLSILDLSPLGHQPMVSADGRYAIVFNGEIYNFAEIRQRLSAMGHTFSGSGDTEVVLHAFREWGTDAVEQFIGMFALAFWDEQEQTLELLRDRVGVKPLYYGWDGRTFCFGSELKALRAFTHWAPDIDRQALGEFLQYGYVPEDRSIFKGVHKLRPGHRLKVKRDSRPIVEPYWSVVDAINEPLAGSDGEIEAELEALLVDACRYRMVSDVPVGVYLSGGVDSSLVTSILARHHNQTIQTFTIGFSEDSHDESRWARKVAEHCGTAHTEYILEPREALGIAQDWGSLFDEPFADSSSIPTLLVSRLASKEVKVVLSADGGDELFSGYNAYTTVLDRMRRLSRVPEPVQRASLAGLGMLPAESLEALVSGRFLRASTFGPLGRKLHLWRELLRDRSPAAMADAGMSYWYPDQIRQLLGSYARPVANSFLHSDDPSIEVSLRDFHHYLPGDILTKVDRTTMAVSIEGREPLLDHRLAEFAFRLPAHLRRGSLGPKHLLKSILYRYVPRELVDRPKMGFSIPMVPWLKGDLRELVETHLSAKRVREGGLMDPQIVNRVVTSFYRGNDSLAQPLWFLLSFEMWRERWA